MPTNNTEVKLHEYQRKILKKLTLEKSLRFNDLVIDDLESEHMNYHLKKLISHKFVTKASDRYSLTDLGKDYTNLLDDNIEVVEKQPKTSIIIDGVRFNDEKREIEYLLSKRLRHPNYGKVGRLSGKVRFGEIFEDAAKRELYEETGLSAQSVVLERIYRKIRKREDGTFVQDAIFYIFLMTDFEGIFIDKTDFQENFWITKRELETQKDLDVYPDLVLSESPEPSKFEIIESIDIAEGF
jgi:8-oxo-dGTP pyrophosphatase MutT (NUDIX family)